MREKNNIPQREEGDNKRLGFPSLFYYNIVMLKVSHEVPLALLEKSFEFNSC
jgi:hypothetical protein